MASTLDIKRRIKSIKSTAKITRAMEMISAVKMRQAVKNVLQIRSYAYAARNVLANISKTAEAKNNIFFNQRPIKNILMIIITSNRGLCGSFNTQIIKKAKEEIGNPRARKAEQSSYDGNGAALNNANIDFVTIGKKGENMVRKAGENIIAAFPDIAYLLNIANVRPVVKMILDEYGAKKYDKVAIAYTDYISAISQVPKIRQILPISEIELGEQIEEIDALAKKHELNAPRYLEYKIEPNPVLVIESLVPRLLEMQIYHAILESKASEESSRMVAMKNATEAANEMADDFMFAFNQIRQSKITQEIAEISAGRVALENN